MTFNTLKKTQWSNNAVFSVRDFFSSTATKNFTRGHFCPQQWLYTITFFPHALKIISHTGINKVLIRSIQILLLCDIAQPSHNLGRRIISIYLFEYRLKFLVMINLPFHLTHKKTVLSHPRSLYQWRLRHEEAVMADLQRPGCVAHTRGSRPARPWPEWIHLLLHAQVSWQINPMFVHEKLPGCVVYIVCTKLPEPNQTRFHWLV